MSKKLQIFDQISLKIDEKFKLQSMRPPIAYSVLQILELLNSAIRIPRLQIMKLLQLEFQDYSATDLGIYSVLDKPLYISFVMM